jgi:hypothetical protein
MALKIKVRVKGRSPKIIMYKVTRNPTSASQQQMELWVLLQVPIRLHGDTGNLNRFTSSLHLQEAVNREIFPWLQFIFRRLLRLILLTCQNYAWIQLYFTKLSRTTISCDLYFHKPWPTWLWMPVYCCSCPALIIFSPEVRQLGRKYC